MGWSPRKSPDLDEGWPRRGRSPVFQNTWPWLKVQIGSGGLVRPKKKNLTCCFQATWKSLGPGEMNMEKLIFLFAVHNHQPLGNFPDVFSQAFDRAYLPFPGTVSRFPPSALPFISPAFSGISC